ncbi:hypothetical protein CONCODRAFT_10040 [Conidiobolus coronatus NRRL 28638]|uniref:Fungal-type protein kinase domain-containing protein n=1 Tax=Conidiobolus coronatus (strain ATCC 28846 / CBS 209.66 / NRRL 28638) TaxID=796925 RepID=A0A137NYA5_CONC2|nr:hypothetical protein CONCODRAFT_10040 [Conidiobolus coronatus NRRL 28638]|eukprot:KXN67853.1 hypothetical protein CONCODRAFT_10040 [Conidiobolus coronatus NRRL 28638]
MVKRRKIDSTDEFRTSTSKFREEETTALNIKVEDVSEISQIIPSQFVSTVVQVSMSELLLPEYDTSAIRNYIQGASSNLTKHQKMFLHKLKLVLLNNNPSSEAPNCERYVDDLMTFLFGISDLDGGEDLTLRPCNLNLVIGDHSFAAQADKEGRKGEELIWLLQEDKHKGTTTYKEGDIQLACAMIAASQRNYNMFKSIITPDRIIGIKVLADEVYFCCINPTVSYLEGLFGEDIPVDEELVMKKIGPFQISDPEGRRVVFTNITSLYNWAVSLC